MGTVPTRYGTPVKKPDPRTMPPVGGRGGLLKPAAPAVVAKKPTAPVKSVDSTLRTIQPVTPNTGATNTSAPIPATIPAANTAAPTTPQATGATAAPAATTMDGNSAPEGEGPVARRMTGLLSRSNEYMQQVEGTANRAMNRRGLNGSSMAVQAVEAARIAAALPIASQEADLAQQDRIARMNLGANERQAASQLAAQFESTYSQQVAAIMSNADLPASARKQYTEHAGKVRDSNLRLVEQMYGIQLDWGTGGGGDDGGPSSGGGGSTGGGTIGTPDIPGDGGAGKIKPRFPVGARTGQSWTDPKTGITYVFTGISGGWKKTT